MGNNFFRWFLNLGLVLSLLFIIPLNMSFVFAEGENTQSVIPKSKADVSSVCGIPINVKDSLILSTVTMCLPGMLEKGKEWKENKCQLVVCKYEAITNNLDPSFCEKQDAYKTCKFIVGEMFAIPPMSVVEYARNMMASILANPVGVAYGEVVTASRATMYGSCSLGALCNVVPNVPLNIAVPIVVVTDAAAVVQTFKDLFENGFDYLSPRVDYCERLPEIKEEMETILKTLDSQESLRTLGGKN